MQMPLFKQAFLRTEKASIFYDSNFRGIVRQSSAMFMLLIINNLKIKLSMFSFVSDTMNVRVRTRFNCNKEVWIVESIIVP